jgi:hypothetical protein
MKTARIIMIIALSIVSVRLSAQQIDPATLVFADNDVQSVNVRGNATQGMPSNEIHIQRRIYDGQGNLFIVGGFTGHATFVDTTLVSAGENDYFLAKFTTSGTRLWITAQGSPNSEIGYDVTVDAAGGVYAVGMFENSCTFYGMLYTSWGGSDAIMHKYDATGKHLWTKVIAASIGEDAAYGVTVDASGFVYVFGSFSGTAHVLGGVTLASVGGLDLFLIKMQPSGTALWSRRYGTAANEYGCRLATGTRAGKADCVTIIWSETIGGSRSYVWYDSLGTLLSTAPKPTPQ